MRKEEENWRQNDREKKECKDYRIRTMKKRNKHVSHTVNAQPGSSLHTKQEQFLCVWVKLPPALNGSKVQLCSFFILGNVNWDTQFWLKRAEEGGIIFIIKTRGTSDQVKYITTGENVQRMVIVALPPHSQQTVSLRKVFIRILSLCLHLSVCV